MSLIQNAYDGRKCVQSKGDFLLFNKNKLLNTLTKSTELGRFLEFGRSADLKQNVLKI